MESEAAPEVELTTPDGDFADPPLAPGAPEDQVAAVEEQLEANPSFDPASSRPVPELTSATREVFENIDGSFTAQVASQPVRFQGDGGEWTDIDLTLADDGSGDVVTEAAPAEVTLPEADPGAVEVETPAGLVTVSAPDVLGAGADAPVETDGSSASVEGQDGLEARVDTMVWGFEQSLVLPDAGSPSSYQLTFGLPSHVQARQGESEIVEFTGADGEVVSRFGGGYAYDSAETGSGEGEVATVFTRLVEQSGRQVTVEVSVDAGWVADEARVFPVVIDPQFQAYTSTNGYDTWAQSQNLSSSQWGSSELKIGTFNSGATVARSFLQFSMPGGIGLPAAGVTVSEAHVSIYATQSQSCTTSGIKVQGLTAGFNSSTVWSSQPAFESAVTSTTQSNKGGGSGCAAGWVDLDATPLAQRWYNGTLANNGLVLRSRDETNSNTWKRFTSGDGSPSQTPTLNVTYNRYPPVPTLVEPAHRATTPTLTPLLEATAVTDPDGTPVEYWFRAWSDNTSAQGGQVINSGWIDDPEWRVPAGELVDGAEYRWTAFASDGESWPVQAGVRRFTPTARLGSSGPSAFQTVGPVSVNLATGNANVSVGGGSLPTLGGGAGVSFSYDSQAPVLTGLTGRYVNDADEDRQIDTGELVVAERTDPSIGFVWGARAPQGGMTEDDFVVQWRGTITVPTTGAYVFGGAHDDGLRVQINGGGYEYNEWTTPHPLGGWGSPVTLTANTPYSIVVDHYDNSGDSYVNLMVRPPGTGGSEFQVPSYWLRPQETPQSALPHGWQMSTGQGGGLVEARIVADAVIFRTAAGGWCCAFTREGENGTTWTPTQPGTGNMSRADTGRITFHAADGTTYVFRPDGTLSSATSPADSQNPAGLIATYTTVGGQPRLDTLTDPVSADLSPNPRVIRFRYGGAGGCTDDEPPGFDSTPPSGMLCRVDFWADQHVDLFYTNDQLAGVFQEPGHIRTDFQYENGWLTAVRSPLANDVAAYLGANDSQAVTEIGYQSGTVNGVAATRATSVTQPEPTQGAARPQATVAYSATQTTVSVAGAPQPNGYTRRVTHDAEGRAVTDQGADALVTATIWDDDDHTLSVLAPTGLRTNTAYDAFGRVTNTWGPAPTGWFGNTTGAPTANASLVPTSSQAYDEGVIGLARTWWNNVSLSGPPDLYDHGQPNQQWASGDGPDGLTAGPGGAAITDNFSGRMTGMINIAQTGTYDFQAVRDGKVRMTIDERQVLDSWTASTSDADATAFTLNAGMHRITLEYADTTGAASVRLEWRKQESGGSWPSFAPVPSGNLFPGYGNVTSSVGVDGRTTTQTYQAPHLRNVTSATTGATSGPGAVTATTTTAHEDASAGHYRRQIGGMAPSGAEVITEYYGTGSLPQKKDDPCTDGVDPVHQGGQVATITDPAPADGPTRVEQYIYDAAGRKVAERANGAEDWTCTEYDERGRAVSVTFPELSEEQPARTVTTDYEVDGNPLISIVSDGADTTTGGDIETVIDMLGRVVQTTDVWGMTTTISYDQLGRQTSSTGPGGTIANTYGDSLGRLTSMSYNGEQIAAVTYDAFGRLSEVSYPSGTGKAGNGSSLAPLVYDVLGRATSVTWLNSGGTLTSHTRIVNVAGDTIDESFDGTDPYGTTVAGIGSNPASPGVNPDPTSSGANYLYDALGRLLEAHVDGTDLTYGYGTPDSTYCGISGSSATANLNSNRTSMTVEGGAPIYSCYDSADRLIKTAAGGIGTGIDHDDHGNVIELGDQELAYDSSDRHIATTDGTDTVTYTRDASGAVVGREATGEDPLRFSSGPAGAAVTLNASNSVIETVLSLPGGASVTIQADEEIWSYPNLQGSTAATADETGTRTGGTYTYDPFGAPLNGDPDNREGELDGGWLGSVGTEAAAGGGLIEMGARLYSPLLGRFLQVDPVAGGSVNDYDYGNGDPVNNTDTAGTDPIGMFGSYRSFHADRAVGYLIMIWKGHCRSKGCYNAYAYSASYGARQRGGLAAGRRAYLENRAWVRAAQYVTVTTWSAVRYAAAMEQRRLAKRGAATNNAVRGAYDGALRWGEGFGLGADVSGVVALGAGTVCLADQSFCQTAAVAQGVSIGFGILETAAECTGGDDCAAAAAGLGLSAFGTVGGRLGYLGFSTLTDYMGFTIRYSR